MSGYLEVPSVSTAARGTIEVRTQNSTSITYKLTLSGLSSNSLFAHIHFAQPGVNGGVAAFLCGGGGKPACPATSGTVSGTIAAGDVLGVGTPATPNNQGIAAGEIAELIAAMKSGVTYANVHSTQFPAGELRGQIHARGNGDDDDD